VLSEELLSRERFWQIARGEFVVTPDSELAELARTRGLAVELVPAPRSDAIARLGWRKIKAGAKIAPDELEANYIRRSDAEIWFKR
jgi:tRNA A37 threonylcarbamoyladenosine modification protein TsaB